jgi:hypothetical protein
MIKHVILVVALMVSMLFSGRLKLHLGGVRFGPPPTSPAPKIVTPPPTTPAAP